MILCLPCVILWVPCFLLERVRKIDRGSNVDQKQVRKFLPVCTLYKIERLPFQCGYFMGIIYIPIVFPEFSPCIAIL